MYGLPPRCSDPCSKRGAPAACHAATWLSPGSGTKRHTTHALRLSLNVSVPFGTIASVQLPLLSPSGAASRITIREGCEVVCGAHVERMGSWASDRARRRRVQTACPHRQRASPGATRKLFFSSRYRPENTQCKCMRSRSKHMLGQVISGARFERELDHGLEVTCRGGNAAMLGFYSGLPPPTF